ncbi:hypothetical protein CCACVL1_29610, partial [Corchorus capsularis]
PWEASQAPQSPIVRQSNTNPLFMAAPNPLINSPMLISLFITVATTFSSQLCSKSETSTPPSLSSETT